MIGIFLPVLDCIRSGVHANMVTQAGYRATAYEVGD